MRLNRNDVCPCGSGRKYKRCCIDGMRLPDTEPPQPTTNYAHPSCYAKGLNDCSSKISREHVVSDRILRLMASAGNSGAVRVTNFRWQREWNSSQLFSPKALASNVLCERHNSALSTVDWVGGKYFERQHQIHACLMGAGPPPPATTFVSGLAFERFLLKVAAGFVASGNAMTDSGRVVPPKVPRHWPSLLWGQRHLSPPDGLYLEAEVGHSGQASMQFSLGPLLTDDDLLIGLVARIHGLRFVLLASGTDRPPRFPRPTCYRPKLLRFWGKPGQFQLGFAWPSGTQQQLIEIQIEGPNAPGR